eukprot:Selendium_serpulae@DN7482_c0_g1_i1.p1
MANTESVSQSVRPFGAWPSPRPAFLRGAAGLHLGSRRQTIKSIGQQATPKYVEKHSNAIKQSNTDPPPPVGAGRHLLHQTNGKQIGTQRSTKKINQSIDQSIDQAIKQSSNQSIDQSINQSIKQSSNQAINQSINRSINRSSNQAIKQSINRSIDQSID